LPIFNIRNTGTKDEFRHILRGAGIDPAAATLLAVAAAQVPYWIVRNPSEVLKTRMRTASTASSSFVDILRSGGAKDLYSGLSLNLLYALPSDWLKFFAYDFIATYIYHMSEGQAIDATTSIVCGGAAALFAETLCTPLDVARNRIMSSGAGATPPQVGD
jgi:solute carrier family 25 S-adenosylmethionine transporter 26